MSATLTIWKVKHHQQFAVVAVAGHVPVDVATVVPLARATVQGAVPEAVRRVVPDVHHVQGLAQAAVVQGVLVVLVVLVAVVMAARAARRVQVLRSNKWQSH